MVLCPEGAMFFRRKKSGPRSYLQIVENRRDGRAVRQHVCKRQVENPSQARLCESAARPRPGHLAASGGGCTSTDPTKAPGTAPA